MPCRTGSGMRTASVWTWFLAAIAAGNGAIASPTPEDRVMATALFKEAKALFDQGQTDAACTKFAESQRLDPGGGTLLNLAMCHESQGRFATAWTEFNEALALARRDGRPDRISFAEEHIASLEPKLSKVVLSVAEAAQLPGLEVRRNGTVVGRAAWGAEIPVDGGAYVFEATAPGRVAWRAELTVAPERDRQTVTVPVLRAAPVAPPVPAKSAAAIPPATGIQPAPPEQHSNIFPWALGGLGVASLAAGSWFGLRAVDKKRRSDDACPQGVCSDEAVKLNEEARTAADISTVTCIVGVAAVGVSTWLLLTGNDEASPSSPRVSAGIAPGAGAVRISGAF